MSTVVQSLELMWKGMVSIFVVIAAIFVVTMLITRIRRKDTGGLQNGKEKS